MKKASLFSLGLLLATSATAQPLTALQSSNYAGTQGIYLNPSSLADSRLRFQFTAGLGGFGFTRQPVPLALVPFGAKLFSAGEPRGVSQADVRGPALMLQLNRKHAIGLTTRYRAGYALSGNYDLVRWINGTIRVPPTGPQVFGLAAEGATEYAFSYALSLLDVGVHHLKIGATAKRLRVLQTVELKAEGTFLAGTAATLPYTGVSVSGRATAIDRFQNASFGQVFTGPSVGRGTAFDLGIAYEFRPKQRLYRYRMDGKVHAAEEMNKYLFRIGASLLDIGQVAYDRLTNYGAIRQNGTLRAADYRDQQPVALENRLLSQFALLAGADSPAISMPLPQAMSLQLDVYLGRSWYGNVVYQSLVPLPTVTSLDRGSVLAFGPRSEGPGGELAGTVYYYPTLQKVALGLHIKAGIFIGGTDNLLGIFADNGLAPHIYGGLAIPIMARRPKDRDMDQASDKRDRCPDVPGVWAFAGCPDTDKDNVEDKDDACPEVAGPAATQGCPDSDKDGVLDKDDACPFKFGPTRFKGCPDTDNDGVADNLDECPTVFGFADMAGCPDTDEDGVPDSRDKCRGEKGWVLLDGCPLVGRGVTADSTAGPEGALLNQLARAFTRGPQLDGQLQRRLQTVLTAQPSRRLRVQLSGADEKQLVLVEQAIRSQLGRLVSLTQLNLSVLLQAGEPAGFAIGLE